MIRRHDGWLAAKVGEELVMMNAENGCYLGLNAVGARVWDLLETPGELDALCEKLMQEYEVAPAVCHAEIEAFIVELVKNGAASIVSR